MWTAKGLVDLYFLMFLHLGTRRCWISPCTLSPDSVWVSQQLPPDMETLPQANETVRLNDVVYSSRLGGLLKHYERRAA